MFSDLHEDKCLLILRGHRFSSRIGVRWGLQIPPLNPGGVPLGVGAYGYNVHEELVRTSVLIYTIATPVGFDLLKFHI